MQIYLKKIKLNKILKLIKFQVSEVIWLNEVLQNYLLESSFQPFTCS